MFLVALALASVDILGDTCSGADGMCMLQLRGKAGDLRVNSTGAKAGGLSNLTGAKTAGLSSHSTGAKAGGLKTNSTGAKAGGLKMNSIDAKASGLKTNSIDAKASGLKTNSTDAKASGLKTSSAAKTGGLKTNSTHAKAGVSKSSSTAAKAGVSKSSSTDAKAGVSKSSSTAAKAGVSKSSSTAAKAGLSKSSSTDAKAGALETSSTAKAGGLKTSSTAKMDGSTGLPMCSCGSYRNGANPSLKEICQGPAERGGSPCYPGPNCNPDWTACTPATAMDPAQLSAELERLVGEAQDQADKAVSRTRKRRPRKRVRKKRTPKERREKRKREKSHRRRTSTTATPAPIDETATTTTTTTTESRTTTTTTTTERRTTTTTTTTTRRTTTTSTTTTRARSSVSCSGRPICKLFQGNQGDGTYYGQNGDRRGACEDWRVGFNSVTTRVHVAMNSEQWFQGKSCGTCLEVTSKKMGFTSEPAVVTDLCPECRAGDLDFALDGDGRWDVTWQAVPCEQWPKVAYILQGSNRWYVKVAVRRSRMPVVKLEAKSGSAWVEGTVPDGGGFFVATGAEFSFPLEVRLTSATGETLRDWVPRLQNDQLLVGGGQFGGGGSAPPKPQPANPEPAEPKLGAFEQELLDLHNMYRCMHGVPAMEWDEGIKLKAQGWADSTGGEMRHSSGSYRRLDGTYLGENLAKGWGGLTAQQAVGMWYNEIRNTDGGRVTSFGMNTGHYTQVVWKASTRLGCGRKNGLVVCEYGPGGNMRGAFDRNVFAPVKSTAQCS